MLFVLVVQQGTGTHTTIVSYVRSQSRLRFCRVRAVVAGTTEFMRDGLRVCRRGVSVWFVASAVQLSVLLMIVCCTYLFMHSTFGTGRVVSDSSFIFSFFSVVWLTLFADFGRLEPLWRLSVRHGPLSTTSSAVFAGEQQKR